MSDDGQARRPRSLRESARLVLGTLRYSVVALVQFVHTPAKRVAGYDEDRKGNPWTYALFAAFMFCFIVGFFFVSVPVALLVGWGMYQERNPA